MIFKFSTNPRIDTKAVVKAVRTTDQPGDFELKDGSFVYHMTAKTRVFGLGEQVRGINKRGWIYRSFCTDEPNHTEEKSSLYGAHNFIIIDEGNKRFGAFFDYPGEITFDIGYTDVDIMTITPEKAELDLYLIEGGSLRDIVRQFRSMIGRSYLPPLWAFGYGQSRWGYVNEGDIRLIADKHQNAGIPIDMIYLDIDYLENFKDFTVNDERFPDFADFVGEMKDRGLRLIPIIDAAVKVEDGYSVYDEGHEKGYFCKDADGEDFVVGVWPGKSTLPDFLNPEAARWFGDQYRTLTDMGIEGFWNDMNEPALFYSEKALNNAFKELKELEGNSFDALSFFGLRSKIGSLANSDNDFRAFYHDTPDGKVCHRDVHNLYGYMMTRSAAEGLSRSRKGQRSLLFSRASYIGMHRYAGLWTGDNHSWWSHIPQIMHQLPALNMCGFLFSGCDIGGFNGNCTRDLVLRWLSLGIFTPLMRNHAAAGTRSQDACSLGDTEAFRYIIRLRYRLIPYLYSEYMKAALHDEMLFRPLCFDYESDERAADIEDQLMLGESLMIAPVYTQNANGRMVYLPEKMTMVRMHEDNISTVELNAGDHYIKVPLGNVVFFVRQNHLLPLAPPATNTHDLRYDNFTLIGDGEQYELYTDDGISAEITDQHTIILKK